MSTEAYLRADTRNNSIWGRFLYQSPVNESQDSERTIIYGLYSHSQSNQNKYLKEIEDAELLNLLSNYNSKISELTTNEQILVQEIVSKRYLAGIDKLIHDQKMATQSAKITAEGEEWDAKIAALATDSAALDTMMAKVDSETEKKNARIAELEAYIETEGYHLTAVDVEIAEKTIQSSKVDIEVLNAANAILRIQADTVAKASELVEIELRIAKIKIDSANTDRDIAKIDLLANDLTIEQAKTEIEEDEIPLAAAKVTLAGLKVDELDAEIAYVATQNAQEATSFNNKINLMNTKQTGKYNALVMNNLERDLVRDQKLNLSELEMDFIEADATIQALLDAAKINVMNNKVSNFWLKCQAAINVASKMAAANIASTLTHTVRKST
jgi:hypothetical protein